MTLPRTLFTLFSADDELSLIDRAVDFAKINEAHLNIAVVGLDSVPPGGLYEMGSVDWWVEERREKKALFLKAVEQLRAHLQLSDILYDVTPHFVEPGAVTDIASKHARYADLSLGVPSDAGEGLVWRFALPGLLFESGRPMLYMVPGRKPVSDAEVVVVAWNGSPEAARAVYSSLDMMKRAAMVRITIVEPGDGGNENGQEPGLEIGAYLSRHGIRLSVDVITAGKSSPADAILKHAREVNADLIIAGAYGHSRFREMIFGGTTNDLLENADRSILFAH